MNGPQLRDFERTARPEWLAGYGTKCRFFAAIEPLRTSTDFDFHSRGRHSQWRWQLMRYLMY